MPVGRKYCLSRYLRTSQAGSESSLCSEQVTGEVDRLLAAMSGAMSRLEIQAALNLKHEDHFRAAYLVPALQTGLIEMTIPDKPKSRLQKYRLTKKGKAWFDKHIGKGN